MSKHSELKKKLLITLGILALIRLGSQIPTYGINTEFFSSLIETNAAMAFLNSITGNSLRQLSIFALSITPYITASIIIQLLTVALPKLEEIAKDGPEGHNKIEKITYVAAGVLGYAEALAMAVGFGRRGLLISFTWYNVLIVALTWGTFALVSVFLGKLIEKKGIGNGISLILLVNILASLPADFYTLYEKFCSGKSLSLIIVNLCIIVICVCIIFIFAMILNNAEKKIPVTYSGKITGNASYAARNSFIPIKVLVMGVMPIIFATSIMSFPGIISAFLSKQPDGVPGFILNCLNSNNWFDFSEPQYMTGYFVYVLLIIFFGYFYTSIAFNTAEIADNLRKSGGAIAGIRPGKPTMDYLNKQSKYLILVGTCGLLILATIPLILSGVFGLSTLSFGGTTVLIVISVIFDTRKQIQTELASGKAENRLKSFHL